MLYLNQLDGKFMIEAFISVRFQNRPHLKTDPAGEFYSRKCDMAQLWAAQSVT